MKQNALTNTNLKSYEKIAQVTCLSTKVPACLHWVNARKLPLHSLHMTGALHKAVHIYG